MRKRLLTPTFLALLLALPAAWAQTAPADNDAAPAAAASTDAPAAAASVDRPDLDDIRNFTRVYEIVRQAYVEKVDNKTLMKAAISGMLAGLDPHSAYLDREGLQELTEDTTGEYSGLGVEVAQVDGELKVVAPIDDTPAARAGIKPGDIILRVDGKPVDPDAVDQSIKQLRGKAGTRITLTLVHEDSDKPLDVTMTRENIAITSVKVRELEPGYAYIRISQFQQDTAADLDRKLTALVAKDGAQKGAILDLRSNPGGLLTAAVGVGDAFLDSGGIVSTRGRVEDANMSFDAHPGDLLNGAPMVALVDNGTASAAEIVAGALKDHHRALIMGRRTFGKGVVQTVLPLDEDHAVKITTARYYTPNGTSIQAEGIKPDIAVADLVANRGDVAPSLIGSEADLPHHLANENADATVAPVRVQDAGDGSLLAERDYALSEALNVLKGLALAKRPAPATTAH
jgi:carboxyl-terminal processing protease